MSHCMALFENGTFFGLWLTGQNITDKLHQHCSVSSQTCVWPDILLGQFHKLCIYWSINTVKFPTQFQVSKLTAHYSSIVQAPELGAHSSPHPVDAELHSALILSGASNQPHCSIIAVAGGKFILHICQFLENVVYNTLCSYTNGTPDKVFPRIGHTVQLISLVFENSVSIYGKLMVYFPGQFQWKPMACTNHKFSRTGNGMFIDLRTLSTKDALQSTKCALPHRVIPYFWSLLGKYFFSGQLNWKAQHAPNSGSLVSKELHSQTFLVQHVPPFFCGLASPAQYITYCHTLCTHLGIELKHLEWWCKRPWDHYVGNPRYCPRSLYS